MTRASLFRAFVAFSTIVVGSTIPCPQPFGVATVFAQAKPQMDMPQISSAGATLTSNAVTACAPNQGLHPTGLPAGFSLQWMTCEDYAANGDQWLGSEDPRLCKASFSGNAQASRYALAPGGCVTVDVGEFLFDAGASTTCSGVLSCGACHVFRAFGHATNTLTRSAFTNNLTSSTLECEGGGGGLCSFTLADWKRFRPCEPVSPDVWPVSSLALGTVTYGDADLCSILGTVVGANGLVDLAQQLIAAKLNAVLTQRLSATVPPAAASCIADTDALVGGLVVPPVGAGFLDPSATTTLTACLRDYNEGRMGDGVCHGLDN
jgi:hypothetical protein